MNNDPKTVLENLLVWSANRSKMFGLCPRKYYHNYIGSWEGWDTSTSPDTQASYRIKHLTSPALEAGRVVHDQIRVILEKAMAGRTINEAIEIKIAQGRFELFVHYSELRQLEELSAKRRKLFLHEEGKKLFPPEISSFLDEIKKNLECFFQLSDVKKILADPGVILPAFLDPKDFEVGYELGVPARLRTDLVFKEDNAFIIVDWKCGSQREDHEEVQGAVYDVLLRSRLQLSPSDIVKVRFYYLNTGQITEVIYSEDQRSELLWAVGEQFETLRDYSDDSRINIGQEAQFPARVSGACLWCNHRLMCLPYLKQNGQLTNEPRAYHD